MMHKGCALLALLAAVTALVNCAAPPPSLALSKIRVDNSMPAHPFIDEYGRVRIFHGINKVQKGFPWYPVELLNDTRLGYVTDWGFNVVRLGTMWSGVVTAPYKLNETYLEIMDTIIQSLAKKGTYVILDLHQDGLSSKFNNYDGVPLWLIDMFNPSEKFPWPFSTAPSNWELNYVTYACTDAFKSIYANESQALDHLGFFWQTVAKRFGKYENVLGYEIMNEPFPGNVYLDPLMFLPGHAGSELLQPMYDKIAPFIRAVDENSMIFYEPVTWGMIFHGDTMGSGFTHVPGGSDYQDHSVLSFHYYCWLTGVDNIKPYPSWMKDICDKLFFPNVLSSIYEDIGDTGGGSFLTEFGNCEATAPKNTTEYQECLSVLSTADTHGVSWSYWDSVFFTDKGEIETNNVLLFSRTYAMAVAGVPIDTKYDNNNGTYVLAYLPNKSITAPTVIYVSQLHYPNGFHVDVTNANYNITNSYYVEVTAVNHTETVIAIVNRK